MKSMRVLLADDDPLILEGISSLLSDRDDIELVGAVTDGAEVITFLRTQTADLALLDVDMPVVDGIAAARIITQQHPQVVVVMFTAFRDDSFLKEAIGAGARGFLTKDIPIEQIVEALHSAMAGNIVMSPKPTAMLANVFVSQARAREADSAFIEAVESLSGRNRRILDLLINAASNRAIAKTLGYSEATTRIYVSEIIKLTGCSSRSEVAVRALKAGLETTNEA